MQLNFRLSYFSITTFLKCPKKFEYIYSIKPAKVLKQARAKEADWGIRVHEAIAQYYSWLLHAKDDIDDSLREAKIIDFFEQKRDPAHGSEYDEFITTCCNNFIKYELNKRPKTAKIEAIEVECRNEYLTGRLDLVLSDRVIDWKTGKPMSFFDESLIVQGSVYLLLTGLPKVDFVFLRTGKVLTLTSPNTKLIQHVVDEIESKTEFEKHVSPLCRFCEYQLWCQFNDKVLWQL